MPTRSAPARLAFALCLITLAVNLPAPLYIAYADLSGRGAAATATAFSSYVLGVLPVLIALGGLADRVGRRPLILAALCLSMIATSLLLLAPGLETLGLARLVLGLGTGMATATATAYMGELMAGGDIGRAANWVTASTSLGFGLGAALTSLCLLAGPTLAPASFHLQLLLATVALVLVWRLPDPRPAQRSAMLRLPCYPAGSLAYGFAILLAWACVGLVIALLPGILRQHALSAWSGFSTFCVISCGLLFQPMARRLPNAHATLLGLAILPCSYAVLAWGAAGGHLAAVLLGAVAASSACYGFIYLGGLAAVNQLASSEKTRASAGFFLLAYLGFSLPVIVTGWLNDRLGPRMALVVFGVALLIGCLLVASALLRRMRQQHLEELAASQV
ncbi:MFS transporter [Pseudomonas guariconensis]|uniref:MFS transporter n=1 Tax=Pseudomonas TaxID=286 RepID=UPI001CE3D9C7|nr:MULTISPECIES: MFS transporter [Pseudomonas]MCO7638997.1 MFS transporter [Pseudomonas sp. S 311-6]MCO7517244.1 MFS transporter [Pseudomonas putida]MCO7565640.1 MFS transporter [Pseudomonas mosselii]MCO7596031.1 MFS transporter [Pseudomonas guariconensis]MCO7607567.1 MFS transporter [Pseudomonas guariconensis]